GLVVTAAAVAARMQWHRQDEVRQRTTMGVDARGHQRAEQACVADAAVEFQAGYQRVYGRFVAECGDRGSEGRPPWALRADAAGGRIGQRQRATSAAVALPGEIVVTRRPQIDRARGGRLTQYAVRRHYCRVQGVQPLAVHLSPGFVPC